MRFYFGIARWALCVCLIATFHFQISNDYLVAEAHAKPKHRKGKPAKPKRENVRKCMRFHQSLGADEESVDMTLTSHCKSEVACKLEWDVICSLDSNAAPTSKVSRSTSMDLGDTWEQTASANVCDNDWQIGSIRWSCVAIQ